jgi:transcriptional regulator with XRE-family HTH domain
LAVGALAVEKLGEYVHERRNRDKLSLRQAADQAHVSFNTLARVERGHIPDLATFMKLVSWLGLDPQHFFTPRQRRGETTPQIVTELLRNDPNLPPEAAERLGDLVSQLYQNYARPRSELTVHLRAARTFDPRAAALMTSMLDTIQTQLTGKVVEDA